MHAVWVHYEYEGGQSGPALLLPPATPEAAEADLLVVPESDDKPYTVRNVPRRDEGGGRTWRPTK